MTKGGLPGLERYAPSGLSFPACGRAPSAHGAADGHAAQPGSPPFDRPMATAGIILNTIRAESD